MSFSKNKILPCRVMGSVKHLPNVFFLSNEEDQSMKLCYEIWLHLHMWTIITFLSQKTDDPEKFRLKRPNNGMPGLIIQKSSGKSFVLSGARILFPTTVELGFLSYLGMHYVLDVEYPEGLALPFSILHRVLFNDNRVVDTHIELYNSAWDSFSSYLPQN